MKKFRIKKVTTAYSTMYTVERRFLGVLWWHNIDCCGYQYTSMDAALREYHNVSHKNTTEYEYPD